MRSTLFLTAALAFALVPALAHAEDAPASLTPTGTSTPSATAATPATKTFSDAEKTAIEDIIKTYITKEHPEILIEASQELQKRDDSTAKTKSAAAIKTNHDKIFSDAQTPVGGNPKGDITVVEFFDYQCVYCKMAEPDMEKILGEDKNIKFIYKDFPILGPVSTTAAKASLASARQNNYIKFHDALMSKKDHLTEDMIYQVAKDSGLDVDKLKKDMADDAIVKQVEANMQLGRDIGVRGTPMFIVGEDAYPGALQYDQLKKAIEAARVEAKKN